MGEGGDEAGRQLHAGRAREVRDGRGEQDLEREC